MRCPGKGKENLLENFTQFNNISFFWVVAENYDNNKLVHGIFEFNLLINKWRGVWIY